MKNDLQWNVLLKYLQVVVDCVIVCLVCVWWNSSWFGDVVWWVSWCSYCCEEWKCVLMFIHFHKMLINYMHAWRWARWCGIFVDVTTKKSKWSSEWWWRWCWLQRVCSSFTTLCLFCIRCMSPAWRSVFARFDSVLLTTFIVVQNRSAIPLILNYWEKTWNRLYFY